MKESKAIFFSLIMLLSLNIITQSNRMNAEDLEPLTIAEESIEDSIIADLPRSIIKSLLQEISGEIIDQRGQSYRHFYNASTDTYTFRSDQLVYKENVIAGTNWITYDEYPIRYVARLNNGSNYFFETPSEMNDFFGQISNNSLFGVGIESSEGILGFYLDFSNIWAQGQYMYYPRLKTGKISAYNQPLYVIFPHLFAKLGGTWYDVILNNRSLYQASHDPRNNLQFSNTSDTFNLQFDTYNFDLLGRTWDFEHGLKFNTTDQLFHLITEFRCRNQNFQDIAMAYEILSSPQSDSTPYQPAEFVISNETHEIRKNVSQAWQAGNYLTDFYSKIEIISENGETFAFSFSDMEAAGFSQKYLELHNQAIPSFGTRKALLAGMYGFGAYTAMTQVNIDPTFSSQYTVDKRDFYVENQTGTISARIGGDEVKSGWDEPENDRYAYFSINTGISEQIASVSNVNFSLILGADSHLEADEYLDWGFYHNNSLIEGYWNETYAATYDTDCFLQTTIWNKTDFWHTSASQNDNVTVNTTNALYLLDNWSSFHNADPSNRMSINIISKGGLNYDPDGGQDDDVDWYESSAASSRLPRLYFEYTLLKPPELDSPADETYSYGFINRNITWIPTERTYSPDDYIVYRNGSVFASGSWSNQTPIVIDLDSINTTAGMHNFTMFINDTNGLNTSDLVWIEVLSSDYPELDEPTDQTLSFAFINENITWIPTERLNSPDSYVVYRNGSLFASGSWTNQTPIVIALDPINTTAGNHNFTMVINDTSDLSVSDEVWIEVLAAIIPEIDSPSNQTLELGFSNENITWTPTERDLPPDSYVVLKNDSQYANGSWSNQTAIVIDIDSINLTLGIHNFTITINDTLNFNASDTVLITVQDTTSPVLNSPTDITYEDGDFISERNITWIATDLEPNNYTIYKNDTINETGSWLSNVNISISVNGLAVGTWNFTIQVNDTSGNDVFDTVYVFVTVAVNDPSVFTAWFETEETVSPNEDVTFYVEIQDVDNISSELNITLFYSFTGFSAQNVSVNMTYDSTIDTNIHRFEYVFAGQDAGTVLYFYYMAFDGENYVYKRDMKDLLWSVPAVVIERALPDKQDYEREIPDIEQLAILLVSVIGLLALIFIIMLGSRKREAAKIVKVEGVYYELGKPYENP